MLRAEELMVGDWVVEHDHGYNSDGSTWESDETTRITAINEYGVNTERNYHLRYDEIEPIPLIPEILEKNLKESIPGLNCMYELGGPYCISLEQEDCWVFGLTKKAARYPMVKIRYVHELQHALRLCGINLEIKV